MDPAVDVVGFEIHMEAAISRQIQTTVRMVSASDIVGFVVYLEAAISLQVPSTAYILLCIQLCMYPVGYVVEIFVVYFGAVLSACL